MIEPNDEGSGTGLGGVGASANVKWEQDDEEEVMSVSNESDTKDQTKVLDSPVNTRDQTRTNSLYHDQSKEVTEDAESGTNYKIG